MDGVGSAFKSCEYYCICVVVAFFNVGGADAIGFSGEIGVKCVAVHVGGYRYWRHVYFSAGLYHSNGDVASACHKYLLKHISPALF